MSTQASVGEVIEFCNKPALVVRVVESSTFFSDVNEQGETDNYILVEKYVELRVEGEIEPKFLTFSSQRFEREASDKRGLDPKIWKRCP